MEAHTFNDTCGAPQQQSHDDKSTYSWVEAFRFLLSLSFITLVARVKPSIAVFAT